MRRYVKLAALTALFLGFLATGVAQQVITTTTTTVVTLPGTTYTSIIEIAGASGEITISVPEHTRIVIVMKPNQTCTVLFVATETPGEVISLPGTTVEIPGTSMAIVVTEQTLEQTATLTEGGTTLKYTGVTFVENIFSTEIPGITTMVVTVSLPLVGEIEEYCEVIEFTEIDRLIFSEVPATLVFVMGGMTYAFPGFTLTFTPPPGFSVQPTTMEQATVKEGYTTTFSTVIPETSVVFTGQINGTTYTTTITEPEEIVTSTITYTTTLKGTMTTPTATTPSPATTTSKPTITTKPYLPPKTTTTQAVPKPPFPLGLLIIAASAVLVLAGALILLIKRS